MEKREALLSWLSWLVDKTSLFLGRTIEKFPLCVKEKGTTTYVVLRWIGVLRFFRNMGWNKIGPQGVEIIGN